MAIYSASVKTISRSDGRSATAAAAYRTGSQVIDERLGVIFDYSRRSGVDHVSMHLPEGCRAMDTHELWNAAEAAENRKNSVVARELLVALPHELDQFQRRELSESIAEALVSRYQVAAEASLHRPDYEGDDRNFHSHIQFTTRRIDADGNFCEKTRELDGHKQGSIEVQWIRRMVEEKINAALERAGVNTRVDHRSLKNQRQAALDAGNQELAAQLDRLPTIHEGPRVTQIRREAKREGRGFLGALNRAAANDEILLTNESRSELRKITAKIFSIEAFRAAKDGVKEGLNWVNKSLEQMKARKSRGAEEAKPAEIKNIAQARKDRRAAELDDLFNKYGRHLLDDPAPPTPKVAGQHALLNQPSADPEPKAKPIPSWKRRGIDDDPSPT